MRCNTSSAARYDEPDLHPGPGGDAGERRLREDVPRPAGVNSLPSVGGGRRGQGGTGPADDVKGDGRAAPPPGYRDAYQEFTRLRSMDKDK